MMIKLNYYPDIIHEHDYHTSMIPAICKIKYKDNKKISGIKHVFTIHNLVYQGWYKKPILVNYFGFDKKQKTNRNLIMHNRVNFMKAGLCYADAITTVSKTYAKEIQTPKYGYNLYKLNHTQLKSNMTSFNKEKLENITNKTDTIDQYSLTEQYQDLINKFTIINNMSSKVNHAKLLTKNQLMNCWLEISKSNNGTGPIVNGTNNNVNKMGSSELNTFIAKLKDIRQEKVAAQLEFAAQLEANANKSGESNLLKTIANQIITNAINNLTSAAKSKEDLAAQLKNNGKLIESEKIGAKAKEIKDIVNAITQFRDKKEFRDSIAYLESAAKNKEDLAAQAEAKGEKEIAAQLKDAAKQLRTKIEELRNNETLKNGSAQLEVVKQLKSAAQNLKKLAEMCEANGEKDLAQILNVDAKKQLLDANQLESNINITIFKGLEAAKELEAAKQAKAEAAKELEAAKQAKAEAAKQAKVTNKKLKTNDPKLKKFKKIVGKNAKKYKKVIISFKKRHGRLPNYLKVGKYQIPKKYFKAIFHI